MGERLNPNITALILTAVSNVYSELESAAKSTPSKGVSELFREVRDKFQITPGDARPIKDATLRAAKAKAASK